MSAAAALTCLAGLLLLLWYGQRRLLYLPMGSVQSPSRSGLADAEPLEIPSTAGVVLKAWFVPSSTVQARATLLFFNGNAGNRSHRAPFAAAMAARGFAVLLFDYRGYGGSSGTPTESGLFADARAVRAYAVSRPDVDPHRVIYIGESLGTGVAVDLAVEHPPQALILRSPFTSITDVAAHHYWFLPVRRLLWDRYDSLSRVKALRCPVLVIAGDRDRVVPFRFSRRLFDAAPEPKRLVVIAGADHNDPELVHGPEVVRAVLDLLSESGG